MPRANDKPFPCEDCRFNINWRCYVNCEYERKLVRVTPFDTESQGCFSGKPRVARSCKTCKSHHDHPDGTVSCPTVVSVNIGKDGWSCTDWEVAE